MKTCNSCLRQLDEAAFGTRIVNGRRYLRTACSSCRTKKRAAHRIATSGTTHSISQRRYNERRTARRRAGLDVGLRILEDCRSSDRKSGRDNDLDLPFVERTIAKPCEYCGETDIRISLDRVDNRIGHLRSNVVACCIRCNYARRDMPHAAWIVVAEGMRKAREAGLFGSWTGTCSRRTESGSAARPPASDAGNRGFESPLSDQPFSMPP
jgi:hypothetical protein